MMKSFIKKASFFLFLNRYSEAAWISLIFLFGNIAVLSQFIGSFKSLVILFFILSTLIFIKIRSLFLTLSLVSLFALQFFVPNRYFVVEVIKGSEIFPPEFKNGYSLGYGLTIANIFLFLIFFLSLFIFWKNPLSRHTKKKIFLILCLPQILFFLVGVFSSVHFSPFLVLSITWIFQYLQMGVVAFMLLLIYLFYSKKSSLIFIPLIFTLFLQSYLSVQQFIHQSYLGLPVELLSGTTFYSGLDENNALLRVSGTFLYSNQLAFIVSLLILAIFPGVKNNLNKLAISLGFLVIILAQCRSIWLAWFFIFLLFGKRYLMHYSQKVKHISKKKLILYFFLLSPLSFIVIPRLLLSKNVFEEGAGIPIRSLMIQEGISALQANSFVGYGVGTNEYVLHSFFPNGSMSIFPAAIHMAYLQILLEVGVLGLLAFFLPFFLILRNVFLSSLEKKSFASQNLKRDTFFASVITLICYYAFQPHVGIVEFPYLGIILAQALSVFINTKHNET